MIRTGIDGIHGRIVHLYSSLTGLKDNPAMGYVYMAGQFTSTAHQLGLRSNQLQGRNNWQNSAPLQLTKWAKGQPSYGVCIHGWIVHLYSLLIGLKDNPAMG